MLTAIASTQRVDSLESIRYCPRPFITSVSHVEELLRAMGKVLAADGQSS